VYEETLTGLPHDTSVQKATSDDEMCMQFNVMPRTRKYVDMKCCWQCGRLTIQLVSAVKLNIKQTTTEGNIGCFPRKYTEC